MSQIILKERTVHLGSQTFFTRDADQYKNTSLSQLYQPPRIAFSQNTNHWLLLSCEYCKVFENNFFIESLQKQPFADIPQNRYSLKFRKLHRKALCWRLILKNLQAEGLPLHKKRLYHRFFPANFAKFLRTPFFYRTPPVTASAPPVAASVFF